jgi:hypothetical protein
MPTQAISSYGIQVRLGNGVALSALTITAATNATPIVVTTSVAHGITDVSYATVTGVLGNTAANGTWVVERVTNTTLKLRNSVGNGAYTSGGSLTPTDTFTVIAELTNLEDMGLNGTVVEVSAHDGAGWSSSIPTFLHGNRMRLSLNEVPANAQHNFTTGLKFLLLNRIRRRFLVVLPDTAKTAWLWTGWVVEHREQAPVAGALTSSVSVEVDGAPVLAAA